LQDGDTNNKKRLSSNHCPHGVSSAVVDTCASCTMVQYYDDFSQKKKKKLSHKASLACSGSVTSRYLDTQLGLKEAVIGTMEIE
jgi:hypothetical protein